MAGPFSDLARPWFGDGVYSQGAVNRVYKMGVSRVVQYKMKAFLSYVIDAHSKWINIHIMQSITAARTIEKLRIIMNFSIVTDNGPSCSCLKNIYENGIVNVTSAPYQSSSGHSSSFGSQSRPSQDTEDNLYCHVHLQLLHLHHTSVIPFIIGPSWSLVYLRLKVLEGGCVL